MAALLFIQPIMIQLKMFVVCFNANPLHYYMLRVLHKADRWLECGLFLNHTPLGQTSLRVGRVSV